MSKFGPSRGELYLRLAISLAGLFLLAGALIYRGIPQGPAFFEVIVIGGGFFGLSAGWTLWKLFKRE